jgi:hypothetical protein
LGAIGIGQRFHQISPEYLEINRSGKGLKLIAKIAETLQALIDIKKSRLTAHRFELPIAEAMGSETARFGEVDRTVQLR